MRQTLKMFLIMPIETMLQCNNNYNIVRDVINSVITVKAATADMAAYHAILLLHILPLILLLMKVILQTLEILPVLLLLPM